MSQIIEQPTTNALVSAQPNKATQLQIFGTLEGFEAGQRMCNALAISGMVPKQYFTDEGKPKTGDLLIALDMAQRTGASPLMVMQNLQVIEGKPGWSAQFIIAAINSSGKFSPLRYDRKVIGKRKVEFDTWEGPKGQRSKVTKTIEVDDIEVRAWATDKSGERLESPAVSIAMAVAEGWYGRNPKWKSMPELMLTYRAASFFGRTYCPEMLMGLPSTDEVIDIGPDDYKVVEVVDIVEPSKPDPAATATTTKRSAAKKTAEVPPETKTEAQPAAKVEDTPPAPVIAEPPPKTLPEPNPEAAAKITEDENPFNFGEE